MSPPPLRALPLLALLAACGSDAASSDGGVDATAVAPDLGTPLDAAPVDAPLVDATPDLLPEDVDRADVPCPKSQPIPPACVARVPLGTNPCQGRYTGPVICVDGRWGCPEGSTIGMEGCQPPPDAGAAPNPG